MKKIIALLLALVMCFALVACGDKKDNDTADTTTTEPTEQTETTAEPETTEPEATEPETTEPVAEEVTPLEQTEISVFIAASLENAFKEIIPLYNATQPNVTVTYNADSSGTLLTQIEEGAACDIFFSAAVKQVKTLDETDNLMIEGSRVDLLKNQVALITYKDSGTTVTSINDIANAKSIALADGSVPVGKYTRQALVNAGLVPEAEDVSAITTEEISTALGGVEINECGNVSKVKEAVKEGSNEVGTVYYSDAYSVKDDVDIIEMISTDLTGDILYPMCRVVNAEADELETAAAEDFFAFLQTDEVLAIFENYMFIINN